MAQTRQKFEATTFFLELDDACAIEEFAKFPEYMYSQNGVPEELFRAVVSGLAGKTAEEIAQYRVFVLKDAAGVSYAWAVFQMKRETRRVHVLLFAIDDTAPIFMKAVALKALEHLMHSSAKKYEDWSFTAFMTEKMYGLYRRIRREFFEVITRLPDFYLQGIQPEAGYFAYKAPARQKAEPLDFL